MRRLPRSLLLVLLLAVVPAPLRAAAASPCVADDATLCFDELPGDRRYQARITYHTAQGGGLAGSGHAVSLAPSGLTRGGAFWFFSSDNPEVLLKLLDGCTLDEHHWVLAAATTNVGYSLVVTDTFTGAERTYTNPDQTSALPVQDTAAFDCADPCANSGLAARIVSFTASPATQMTGATETLSWQLAGAGPFSQSLTGTEIAGATLLPSDRSYRVGIATAGPHSATLAVTGRCGTASSTASYAVQATCAAPHVVSFTTDYSSYCAGQSAVLSWQTSGSGDVSISPAIGPVPPTGQATVPANVTTAYTLTATAPCGADSAMATVQVLEGPTIVSFTADSYSVPVGGSTTLRYDIEGTIDLSALESTIGNIPAFVDRQGRGSLTSTYNASYSGTDTVTLEVETNRCPPQYVQSSLTIVVH
jgi:hypothetical protein